MAEQSLPSRLLRALTLARFPRSAFVALLGLLVVGSYAWALSLVLPTLGFAPDSWSYFELARSFSSPDPYRFHTFRSYLPHAHSAAFPFGYPALLWVAQALGGPLPELGVWINAIAALGTLWLAGLLAEQFTLDRSYGWLSGGVLLFFPPYLDEVLAARAMPLGIALILAATLLIQAAAKRRNGWGCLGGGLACGLVLLVRFDALLLCVLLGGYGSYVSRRLLWFPVHCLGLALGALPWIWFSVQHFGSPWFSDNSWVALSSTPAFVTDYPALAERTLFSDPTGWLVKCARQALALGVNFLGAVLQAKGLLILGLLCLTAPRRTWSGLRALPRELLLLVVLAALALAPQITTGYTDFRYFSLTLTLLALALAAAASGGRAAHSTLPLGFLLVLVAGAASVNVMNQRALTQRSQTLARADAEARTLAALASCHTREPETLYLLDNPRLATELGARFQVRAGMLPRNFAAFDPATRARFNAEFGPLRVLGMSDADASIDLADCRFEQLESRLRIFP